MNVAGPLEGRGAGTSLPSGTVSRLAAVRARALQGFVSDAAVATVHARPHRVVMRPETYWKEREVRHHPLPSLSRYTEVHSMEGTAVFAGGGQPPVALDVVWEMVKEGDLYRGVWQVLCDQAAARGAVAFSCDGRQVVDADSFDVLRAAGTRRG